MKSTILSAFLMLAILTLSSWGFHAHQRINRIAVFTLPSGVNRFYKANINYIAAHAVDADKRRYADSLEAPRHYLDVELYEAHIDSIPRRWEHALQKYGIKKLNSDGILPWQIQLSYLKLVNAFKKRDSSMILIYSAYLGHYIADAHVPLHTTKNHNGQLTGQVGIHAFWESRVPELFSDQYNFFVGKAEYVNNPLAEAWRIITHTHSLVDSVLLEEKKLSNSFPIYKKYSYSKRNNIVVKQYSEAYARTYQLNLNDMMARQMQASIFSIGCFWYSAWIDAGQPTLENMPKKQSAKEQASLEIKAENTIIGREP